MLSNVLCANLSVLLPAVCDGPLHPVRYSVRRSDGETPEEQSLNCCCRLHDHD